MTPNKPQLQQKAPFRAVNQPKGNPFLSLRAIPFLIVLAGSLAIQPAVGASPVVTTIAVTAPNEILGIVASPNRSQVYATDYLNNRVAVIDTVTNQISSFIHTSNPPIGLGISPDGNTLYVTEDFGEGGGVLEEISIPTLTSLFVVTVGGGPFLGSLQTAARYTCPTNSAVMSHRLAALCRQSP